MSSTREEGKLCNEKRVGSLENRVNETRNLQPSASLEGYGV